jgi:hypothetical protein
VGIEFYIMSLPGSIDRRTTIVDAFAALSRPPPHIVVAVDGKRIDDDPRAVALFTGRLPVGTEMRNTERGETWTFDGRPSTGFSHLHRMGHLGYKGLWIANLLAFQTALETQPHTSAEWACVLEDDAVIDPGSYGQIVAVLNGLYHGQAKSAKVSMFDGQRGAACVCYRLDALPTLAADLHPMSEFALREGARVANLWDWLLVDYFRERQQHEPLFYHNAGDIVKSGAFVSTIS